MDLRSWKLRNRDVQGNVQRSQSRLVAELNRESRSPASLPRGLSTRSHTVLGLLVFPTHCKVQSVSFPLFLPDVKANDDLNHKNMIYWRIDLTWRLGVWMLLFYCLQITGGLLLNDSLST